MKAQLNKPPELALPLVRTAVCPLRSMPAMLWEAAMPSANPALSNVVIIAGKIAAARLRKQPFVHHANRAYTGRRLLLGISARLV